MMKTELFSTTTGRAGLGVIAGAIALLAMSGSVSAGTITVDGILKVGEYLGGTEDVDYGTKSIQWYNDHPGPGDRNPSHYGIGANLMNDLHWEISGSGSDYLLNVFFEVPGYARRMIWNDPDENANNHSCDYAGGAIAASGACRDLADEIIAENSTLIAEIKTNQSLATDLEAVQFVYERFLTGTHHSEADLNKKMYDSEKFELKDSSGATLLLVDWDDGSATGTLTGGALKIQKSSLDYLTDDLNYGGNLGDARCSLGFCAALDTTASLEAMWMFGSYDLAFAGLGLIDKMRLHLSDEAIGLPSLQSMPQDGEPSPVPAPATLALFGIGLAGLGWSRRKKIS